MIEVTCHEVDGVRFYKPKIVYPQEVWNGIPIEYISRELRRESQGIIWLLGLKRVGFDFCRDADIYTFKKYWVVFKGLEWTFKVYWWLMRFLYDNARMFKQIPPTQPFSWKYFTPYVWIKKLTGLLQIPNSIYVKE